MVAQIEGQIADLVRKREQQYPHASSRGRDFKLRWRERKRAQMYIGLEEVGLLFPVIHFYAGIPDVDSQNPARH